MPSMLADYEQDRQVAELAKDWGGLKILPLQGL